VKAAVPALASVTDAVAAVVDKVEAAAEAVAPVVPAVPVAPAAVVVDLSGAVAVPLVEATVVTTPPETAPVENKQ
jgi:hypothetical protein